ncbi:MAG: CvpA family protein [Lachnospiraceae bacterium]|nr:CvpA family protein [Lachnospiraceae bacterium]
MGEWNWLLVAVVALFIILIMRGYYRGFLRMAVSMAGLILTIFVTTKILPNAAAILTENPYVYQTVYDKITEVFHEVNAKANNATKEEQNEVIETYELPGLIVSDLIVNNTSEVYEELKVTLFEEYIGKYLTLMIIKSGTFVIIYLILGITLWIVIRVTGFISKIPVIHGLNKALGLVTGFLTALILVWIFFFVMVMFLGNPVADNLLADVKDSQILSLIYNYNILFQIL